MIYPFLRPLPRVGFWFPVSTPFTMVGIQE
jgi:hypothetical protein